MAGRRFVIYDELKELGVVLNISCFLAGRDQLTAAEISRPFAYMSNVLLFFSSVVYLTLALNSPVKIYSLIHANKKIHINNAKYTIKCFLHIFT